MIKTDLNKIYETIKEHLDKTMVLGLYELEAFKEGGSAGFFFRIGYKITEITNDNQRIRVLVKIWRFDCWDLFKEKAMQIFLGVLRRQITDTCRGIEDVLDIVISFQ